jgi:mono/diheme cytochrome c family protein
MGSTKMGDKYHDIVHYSGHIYMNIMASKRRMGMKNKIAFMVIAGLLLIVLAACGTGTPTPEPARPSNPGGAGPAVGLTGDPASGQKIFETNCVVCHGSEGKGGVENAGSADGTVPPLNPIDDTMKSSDYKTFATNIDLFVEHGSTPAMADGQTPPPPRVMIAWGDTGGLQPQQIADVIAYVISLNK